MKKDLNRDWDAKMREAIERAKEVERSEAEKRLNQVRKDYDDDFKILRDQIDQLNDSLEQSQKQIQTKDYTIQSKESEIFINKGNIMNLEEEIEKLKNQLANGDQSSS